MPQGVGHCVLEVSACRVTCNFDLKLVTRHNLPFTSLRTTPKPSYMVDEKLQNPSSQWMKTQLPLLMDEKLCNPLLNRRKKTPPIGG